MSRPSGTASYRAVLHSPGLLRPFVAVNLGRLSYATLPLSLLLTVQAATGSFAAAGISLGALSAATAIMPVKSRLIDRLGARRVLPVLGVVFAAALIGSAASSAAGVSSPVVYIGLGAAAGLATPPLGPSMRALWAALAPEPAVRQRAYAFDVSVEETIQVAGPLVVAGMLTVSTSAAVLVVAAVLNVVGAIGVATAAATPSASAPAPASRRARLVGPFTARGFGVLVVVILGVGVGSAPLEVAVVARARELGAPSTAAYLLAAVSIGSALGGLLWGHRRHQGHTATQLSGLVVVMALGSFAAAGVSHLWSLAVILLVAGMVNAPARIVAYLAADRLVPVDGRTEATTWISTANNLGASAGVSVAGLIIDRSDAAGAFIAGAAVLMITVALLLTTRGHLRPHDGGPL